MIDVKMTPELAMHGVNVYMQRVNEAIARGYKPLKNDIKAMYYSASEANVEITMNEIYYKIKNKPTYFKFNKKVGKKI